MGIKNNRRKTVHTFHIMVLSLLCRILCLIQQVPGVATYDSDNKLINETQKVIKKHTKN